RLRLPPDPRRRHRPRPRHGRGGRHRPVDGGGGNVGPAPREPGAHRAERAAGTGRGPPLPPGPRRRRTRDDRSGDQEEESGAPLRAIGPRDGDPAPRRDRSATGARLPEGPGSDDRRRSRSAEREATGRAVNPDRRAGRGPTTSNDTILCDCDVADFIKLYHYRPRPFRAPDRTPGGRLDPRPRDHRWNRTPWRSPHPTEPPRP